MGDKNGSVYGVWSLIERLFSIIRGVFVLKCYIWRRLIVDYDAYFVRFVKRRPCTKNEDEDLKDTIAILLHDVGYYCVASCGAF